MLRHVLVARGAHPLLGGLPGAAASAAPAAPRGSPRTEAACASWLVKSQSHSWSAPVLPVRFRQACERVPAPSTWSNICGFVEALRKAKTSRTAEIRPFNGVAVAVNPPGQSLERSDVPPRERPRPARTNCRKLHVHGAMSALALAAVVSVDAPSLAVVAGPGEGEEATEARQSSHCYSPCQCPLSGGSTHHHSQPNFGGIQRQTLDELDARGQSITIMVVATVVLASHRYSQTSSTKARRLSRKGPLRVTERMLKFDLGGVPFSALLIDSPGYHDSLNLGRSIKLVTDHIDSMFATTLANERRPHRKPESERETHLGVDVVLYFFSNPNPNPNQGLVTVTLALTRCS